MFGLGVGELVVVLVLVVLLFGSKKIPELAKGIGQGVHELKKSLAENDSASKQDSQQEDSKESKRS